MSENGSRPSYAYIAGLFFTLLLAAAGLVLGDMRSDLSEEQRRNNEQGTTQARQGAEIDGLQAQLNRIEAKLDRVLDAPGNQRSTRPFP